MRMSVFLARCSLSRQSFEPDLDTPLGSGNSRNDDRCPQNHPGLEPRRLAEVPRLPDALTWSRLGHQSPPRRVIGHRRLLHVLAFATVRLVARTTTWCRLLQLSCSYGTADLVPCGCLLRGQPLQPLDSLTHPQFFTPGAVSSTVTTARARG